MADWRRRTWFSVKDGQRFAKLRVGTRLGDSLADLMFSLAFARAPEEILAGMRTAGLSHAVPLADGGVFGAAEALGQEQAEILLPTFTDDMVLPVFDGDAPALLQKVEVVAMLVLGTCRRVALL